MRINIKLAILSFAISIVLTGCLEQPQNEDKNTSVAMEKYTEQYRPHFHFTPDSMWMNDPNGMVYFEGEYHLFYQYYPDDNVWGPMHWGHAISTDLVHWEHLPIGLYPDEHGWIFSGSAVVDWNNTSGFGSIENPPLIAIFTYHNHEIEKEGKDTFQTQGIAYSTDKGRTWKVYDGNPVLENPGIRDFRDPKVFWYAPDEKWIMTLAIKDHVGIYSSNNLKSWKHESDFGFGHGIPDVLWECPDMFSMEIDGKQKWVMLVSTNPGGFNGGSTTQYFIGGFDGETFINDNPSETILYLDWGKDNYAGVTWSDIPEKDGRRIFIGWMSNWQYATKVPTERWRSAMTIPRTLQLQNINGDIRLRSKPVAEMEKLNKTTQILEAEIISGEEKIDLNLAGRPVIGRLEITFRMSNETHFGFASGFGIELSNSIGETLTIGYEPEKQQLFCDRTNAGKTDFSEDFPARVVANHTIKNDELKLSVFIDVASAEIFADGGKTVMTNIFFPNEDFNLVKVYSKNGSVKLKEGKYIAFDRIY